MIFKELSKMKDAKGQLKKLANGVRVGGEYHTMEYHLTEFQDGMTGEECMVYIHGYKPVFKATWNEALREIRNEIVFSKA